ncbi:MAG: EpsI family protein [Bryobacterales bacterium]|nr:EpsI family protein [Bryobacterales bacterium]
MFRFLSYPPVRVLTIFLLLQSMAFYALGRTEPQRPVDPLSQLPKTFGNWELYQEGVIDKDTQEVLKADDTLTRTYVDRQQNAGANLFIAYFQTQRTGKAPHSPKNCLPGNGWTPTVNDKIMIDVPGHKPIEANRYIVQRGEDRSLVVYWYQTSTRTVASEYKAKVYTVLDSIQHNRSDTAIVKVTLNIPRGSDQEKTTEIARHFVRSFYDKLIHYFPA